MVLNGLTLPMMMIEGETAAIIIIIPNRATAARSMDAPQTHSAMAFFLLTNHDIIIIIMML